MKRAFLVLCAACSLGAVLLLACGDDEATGITVERLPDVRPNLPEVPTIPPPPHPVQYPDNSYSVYGVRHRVRNTLDTEVTVTGYIVEIYRAPECPEGERCPTPVAPHMWVADTANETDAGKRLTVVGYAENQAQIDEAIEQHENGTYEPPDPELGILPVPFDFAVGAKVKVTGRFARLSGAGFNISDGLLDYNAHQIVEPAPGAPPAE